MIVTGYKQRGVFVSTSVFVMSIIDFKKNKKVFSRARLVNLFASVATALAMATTMGAKGQTTTPAPTQLVNDKTPGMPFWGQVMAERRPLVSVRQFYSAQPAVPLIINEDDATKAFNVIIGKKNGVFTADELTQIENGLHISEVGQRLQAVRAEAQDKSPEEQRDLLRPFTGLFMFVFICSPDWAATKQLWDDFDRFIPDPWFQKSGPELSGNACSIMNMMRSVKFRCPAFDKSPVGASGQTASPNEITLAKMSLFAYSMGRTAELPHIDGYTLTPPQIWGAYGFVAYTFKKGDQIVIAFKGTEPDWRKAAPEFVKDWGADFSWVFGNTANFNAQMAQATKFLEQVQESNPSANITLTGHSLGGATAEILGSVTGLPTATYNAPGIANRMSDLAQILEPLANIRFNNKGNIVNYVTQGDLVSAVDTHVGSICTIAQPGRVNWLAILYNHDLGLMVQDLQTANLPRAPQMLRVGEPFPTGLACSSLQ
jgi:hypothetical protein